MLKCWRSQHFSYTRLQAAENNSGPFPSPLVCVFLLSVPYPDIIRHFPHPLHHFSSLTWPPVHFCLQSLYLEPPPPPLLFFSAIIIYPYPAIVTVFLSLSDLHFSLPAALVWSFWVKYLSIWTHYHFFAVGFNIENKPAVKTCSRRNF